MGATEEFEGLSRIFGLNRRQQLAILVFIQVAVVNIHILWACGWLSFAGFAAPFAQASDFQALNHTVAVGAKISISREIRDETQVLCATKDQILRNTLYNYIEQLQLEYQALTGSRYSPPACI